MVATATQKPSITTATATTATTVTTITATTTATTVTTATTTTTVKPSLPEGNLIGKRLSVGDRMYDFTVTDSDGNTLTLSQMLQEKEMVVLNFWYINCSFCVKEFPAMNEAYAAYQDRVGMVALNPYDSVVNIGQYRANNASLTFPMASCPSGWVQTFALRGFPTTVVIDRDGVIRQMHTGALLKVSDWESLLLPYLS
jgi:peroxiredoxin